MWGTGRICSLADVHSTTAIECGDTAVEDGCHQVLAGSEVAECTCRCVRVYVHTYTRIRNGERERERERRLKRTATDYYNVMY